MSNWWQRHPNHYDGELAAWKEYSCHGYTWYEDVAAKEKGRIVITVEWPRDDETLNFTVEYPDTFPYFQATVTLTNKKYERHQHPVGGNLCLLGRNGEDWLPGRDRTAAILVEKFPIIEKTNAGELTANEIEALEDHVGEALSSFLDYAPNSVIIVPDDTPPPNVETGRLDLLLQDFPHNGNDMSVRGAVKDILDNNQHSLTHLAVKTPNFTIRKHGFWMRLKQKPTYSESFRKWLYQELVNTNPHFEQALSKAKQHEIIFAGYVYEDEVSWRKNVDDWIFLTVRIRKQQKRSALPQLEAFFVRADWGGEDAWLKRAPMLRPLRQKSVLLVGAGAIGSPVALQLARAGVGKLIIIDNDHVQVGNTPRWALGWQSAGVLKTDALESYIQREYPYTKIETITLQLGVPFVSEERPSQYTTVSDALSTADLVIDASAHQRVTHFLADLAMEHKTPFLWLTLTSGAAGGVVGRILPTTTAGCWHCYQHRLSDGTIQKPPDYSDKEIQPAGCAQPTYIGAGIDSDEVPLLASRLAVATLCRNDHAINRYKDFAWDVAVVKLAEENNPTTPTWTTYKLKQHNNCQVCNSK